MIEDQFDIFSDLFEKVVNELDGYQINLVGSVLTKILCECAVVHGVEKEQMLENIGRAYDIISEYEKSQVHH